MKKELEESKSMLQKLQDIYLENAKAYAYQTVVSNRFDSNKIIREKKKKNHYIMLVERMVFVML